MVSAATLAVAASSSVGGARARSARETANCISAATCYTPHQFQVAYGVQPLLQHGIDGRGETVVLPELAESQLSPPNVTDLRKDFAVFDRLFHLPAPHLRFTSTFAGPKAPWLAYGEEVLDAELVHTIAPRAALTILLVKETRWTAPTKRSRPRSPPCAWAPRKAASSLSAPQARSVESTALRTCSWKS